MEIYLVGGAVRDQLMGRKVTERDWVVVGATPKQMLELGYTQVGKDFPVFLHPETGEEYALARTERKTSKGYTGFEFATDTSVTLEEDLLRRDLTINAIAQDKNGTLIDPYGGKKDIDAKVLRHVSEAFAEDPVRILRIARFAARFSSFSIHPSTLSLMKQMVENGEVDSLVAERVWKECSRALSEVAPVRFFSTLAECGALPKLFVELRYPEAMLALRRSAELSEDGTVRFAALVHQLNDQERSKLCQRLRIPTEYHCLAQLVARHHQEASSLPLHSAQEIAKLLENLDAFRRLQRIRPFMVAVQAIHTNCDPRILPTLEAARQASINIDAKPFLEQGLKNEEIGLAIRQARIDKIQRIL